MRVGYREPDNPIFYKVETYLDCLLIHKIHVILCFVKIVRMVLKIYERDVHRQTDKQITPFFTMLRPI